MKKSIYEEMGREPEEGLEGIDVSSLGLQQPKELAPLLLLQLRMPNLLLHLILRDVSTKRVPRHGHHTQHGGEHASEHGSNTLWSPSQNLWEGTFGETLEIEDVDGVTDGVTLVGHTERGTLVETDLGDAATGLGFKRSFDETDGETGFQMPFNVACLAEKIHE